MIAVLAGHRPPEKMDAREIAYAADVVFIMTAQQNGRGVRKERERGVGKEDSSYTKR